MPNHLSFTPRLPDPDDPDGPARPVSDEQWEAACAAATRQAMDRLPGRR